MSLDIESWELSLDSVLKGKVQGLSWEVSDNVRHVSSPEAVESLLLVNSGKAVNYSFVLLGCVFHTLLSVL